MQIPSVGVKAGVLGVAVAAILALTPAVAADSPLGGLLGSWGGGGLIKYTDGSTEKLRCSAHYSGGTADISMAIHCTSSAHNIDISGRLHDNGGHVGGSWSESNLGMSGSATGHASAGHITLALGGGVDGSMSMNYSGSHQDVAISVGNAALQSVSMSLGKH